MNPAVAHFYSAQKKVLLSVHATIFEKHGWTAPKRVYYGTFEPETGWANKSKGLVYIMYEDEKKRLKSDLSDLAKHGLRILVQDSDSSSSSPEASPAKLKTPPKQNRKAFAGRDPAPSTQRKIPDSSDEDEPADGGARPPFSSMHVRVPTAFVC